MDLRASTDGKDPLERVPVDTFAFTLDGAQILVQSDAIFAATTYAELFAAIQARVAELGNGVNVPATNSDNVTPADAAAYAKLANFTVELGSAFTVKNQAGEDVSGTQIVLTDAGGAVLTPQGFVNKAGVIPDPGYTLYAQLNNVAPSSTDKLITTNLDANNVGYGSQGATVNLAGQSASDKGVEEIKVTATNGVWLTALKSKATTDHLERIELQTGSNGYFRVGTQKNADTHVVALVDQQFADVTTGGTTTKGGGLVDVQQVEAGAAGSTAINSWISDAVLSRYEMKDTGIYTADDSQAAITYNLTSGQDVLNLAIDTDVLEAVDTKVNVSTGAGDDIITVMASKDLNATGKVAAIQESGTGWLINQQLNNNVKIDAGAGNDWVLTPGSGNATINAGAGNDVVRVDNAGDRAVFVFNNATTDVNELIAGAGYSNGLTSNSDNSLSAGANNVAQTFDFYKAVVKVTFKGFESKYITIDSTNYTTTTQQINQAIKAAVNNDPVLNKLIAAMDNDGNALAIESLIDGTIDLTDLVIDIQGPATYSTSETDIAAAKAAGKVMLANGEAAKADAVYLADGKTSTTATIDTTTADGLYDTQYGTSSTGANPFAAAPNVADDVTPYDAGTDGTFAVTVDASSISAAGVATLGGLNIALTDQTDDTVAAGEFVAALDALKTANGATTMAFGANNIPLSALTFTSALGVVTIEIDADWMADNSLAAAVVGDVPVFAAGGATGAAAAAAVGVAGTPATEETQTITFAAATADGTLNVGGITVNVSNGDADTVVAGAVETALNAAFAAGTPVNGVTFDTGATVSVAGGVVTIEYPASAGDVGAITVSQAGVGANITGGVSGAESDNVVNLGTGSDVLTLGTGAESNDTVVFTGYNLGEKSIVNFTTAVATSTQGDDLLDFTSYLNTVDANKAVINNTVAGDFGTTNAVVLVNFTADNSTLDSTAGTVKYLTFDELTESNVKALLNNTNAGGAIDAVSGLSATAVNNNVLMVQGTGDDANVYKAFHVTTGATSATADVKLIGTFDFGDDLVSGLATADLV
ncbi:beta strand repeat-containing protein [Oceanospirillum maris]|uniref:beta strand repeat-containing protein n=1 Tax=Oceanospirillum maris TaxID=64977 RepID=UPI0004151652|nr:hypothetical protein [Oceanospirillum maris]